MDHCSYSQYHKRKWVDFLFPNFKQKENNPCERHDICISDVFSVCTTTFLPRKHIFNRYRTFSKVIFILYCKINKIFFVFIKKNSIFSSDSFSSKNIMQWIFLRCVFMQSCCTIEYTASLLSQHNRTMYSISQWIVNSSMYDAATYVAKNMRCVNTQHKNIYCILFILKKQSLIFSWWIKIGSDFRVESTK